MFQAVTFRDRVREGHPDERSHIGVEGINVARGRPGRRSRPANIDEMDRRIAKLLHEDGRRSNAELARRVGVSESTIRRKIQRMIDHHMLRITVAPDLAAFGFPVSAFIGLDVDVSRLKEITRALGARPEVTFIATVTGPYDLMLWVTLRSLPELKSFLEERVAPLEGVRQTESLVVLDINKMVMGRVE